MRPTRFLAIVVLSVLALRGAISSCEANGKLRPTLRDRPSERLVENPLPEVQGVGKTREEAEAEALRLACDQVGTFLTGQSGATGWKPSPALLRQIGATRLIGEPQKVDLPGDGENVRVKMIVDLTPDVLGELQKQIRQQRKGERQRVAALGLAGVLAIVLVVFGYLKLEDLTKGYHTTLLRLTALAVLSVTAVCLWRLG